MTVNLSHRAEPVRVFHDSFSEELLPENPALDWLLEGYLAAGSITLLTGARQGVGKTTLATVLLKRLETAGTLAGLAVRAGKVLVVSEYARPRWHLWHALHSFGSNLHLICRPFPTRPSHTDWEALLEHALQSCRTQGLELLVIDSLAQFLPAEADPGAVLAALARLERLTEAGIAVLLLHQPRPETSAEGFWSAGNGALAAIIDIFIEMHHVSRPTAPDRRRRLLASSCFEQTPRRLVVELDPAGTDYRAVAEVGASETKDMVRWWPTLRAVLAGGSVRETRQGIRSRWPADQTRPSAATLYRWLERAVTHGLVIRDGNGARCKPFRYWLRSPEDETSGPARPAPNQACS
jgi:archaellum biogenesis ATPase FlaH